MSTVFIYTLADPRNGAIRYVGKADVMQRRFYAHLYSNPTTHKGCWIRSLQLIGLKPIMEELESFTNVPDSVWQEAERFWITTLRFYGCALTNLDSGGLSGKKASAFTRAKMRASSALRWQNSSEIEKQRVAKLGKKQSQFTIAKRAASLRGQKRSPEMRAKMKLSAKARSVWAPQNQKGQVLSAARIAAYKTLSTPERNAKISAKLRGIKRSNETRAKMRDANLGKIIPKSTREKIRVSVIAEFILRKTMKSALRGL